MTTFITIFFRKNQAFSSHENLQGSLTKSYNLLYQSHIYRIRKFESKEIESSYIGIDDFSFKKRTRYGSLVCDLVSKKVIKIFNDRVESLEGWLKNKK